MTPSGALDGVSGMCFMHDTRHIDLKSMKGQIQSYTDNIMTSVFGLSITVAIKFVLYEIHLNSE